MRAFIGALVELVSIGLFLATLFLWAVIYMSF
jgi:hypothetical protein